VSAAELLGLLLLGALIFYALSGGADFGGGIWDLFASGPRAAAQRKLIERALAPIWEANHVWLIFVVTVLFVGFPSAFAAIMTALHVPFTLLLLGIVLRGSAFVFRQYGGGEDAVQQRWGTVFAVASLLSPLFLGAALAGLTGGEIRITGSVPSTGFFSGWCSWFAVVVAFLTLACFALLAAVYLSVEAADPALQRDFVRRALIAQFSVAASAVASLLALPPSAELFRQRLLGSAWSVPVLALTALTAGATLFCLYRVRLRAARLLAIAQVTLIIAGWGLAQSPYLVAPDVTLQGSAAPPATLHLLLPVIGAGALLLFPSLYLLLRIFKRPA
jgi:cytochrome bd ubiquinol oxidase subunit II